MPVKTTLTKRNLEKLNWLINQGRRAESPVTIESTASSRVPSGSWHSSVRETLERRLRSVQISLWHNMMDLLRFEPEGPELLRKSEIRVHRRFRHVCLKAGPCDSHAEDLQFWKEHNDYFAFFLLSLRIKKFGPMDGSSTLYMLARDDLGDYRKRWPKTQESIEKWIRTISAGTSRFLSPTLALLISSPGAPSRSRPFVGRGLAFSSRSSRRLARLPPEFPAGI